MKPRSISSVAMMALAVFLSPGGALGASRPHWFPTAEVHQDTTKIDPCNPCVCIPGKTCPLDLVSATTPDDYCYDPPDFYSFADTTTHMTASDTDGVLESSVMAVPDTTDAVVALWNQYLDMPRGSGFVQVTEFRFFKNGAWSTWRNTSPSRTLRSGDDRTWGVQSDQLPEAVKADSVQIRYRMMCVHSLSTALSGCNPVTYGVLYRDFALYAISGVPQAPVFGIAPVSLPQSTFVSGTMAGTGCFGPTVTAGHCWPGVRGSDVGAPAAIHDNVNSPVGDSIVVEILSPFRSNGMGVNWHFGYDKSVGGGLTIARTNASYNASFDVPRVIYRLFDPASKTWSPYDSSALDADDVTVGVFDTTLTGNGFRMVWPPRDKLGSNLPGGFTINGQPAYAQLAFLPRGTRLQYYFKAVDLLGTTTYQFQPDVAAHEKEELPTLPGTSIVAPDILEFDVLPRVYVAGPGGTLVAGKTTTPLLNLDGAYGAWSYDVDPVTQALRALGVRADRYRLLQGVDYGNNIGGHELSAPTFGPGTNYFPNMNEYGIKDSLAGWYRIIILSGHLRTNQWIDEADARLLREWWIAPTGVDGGDRCVFSSSNDFFNSLLNGGAGIAGPQKDSLATSVFGVGAAAAAWDGTLTKFQPTMDDRFVGGGPGLGAPGGFTYLVDGGCPIPKRSDGLTRAVVAGTADATVYPGSTQAAAVLNMQDRDSVPDHDRNKALGYAYSIQFIRQGGENLVDTRAQVLYKFLTSCRGPRSTADTTACWPCPSDANKYGNWAVLSGFQTGIYGPLYPIQNSTLALSSVEDRSSIPAANRLQGNFPNPFNPETIIRFISTRAGHVELRIFDVAGRLVQTISKDVGQGVNEVRWNGQSSDGRNLASGVYFVKMKYPDGAEGSNGLKIAIVR